MIRRILLVPIFIILTVIRLLMDMALRISSWVFYVLGGIFLLTTICCYYMQIESGEGLRSMIIGSGIMFIIPAAASIISGVIEVAAEIIRDQMRSA